jgi:hypothetical protein
MKSNRLFPHCGLKELFWGDWVHPLRLVGVRYRRKRQEMIRIFRLFLASRALLILYATSVCNSSYVVTCMYGYCLGNDGTLLRNANAGQAFPIRTNVH